MWQKPRGDGGPPSVRNAKLVLCLHEWHGRCRNGAKCAYAHSLQEVRPPTSGLLNRYPSTRYHYWDPKDPSSPPMPANRGDDPPFVAVAHWTAKALMDGSDVPEWCQRMLEAGVEKGLIEEDWRKLGHSASSAAGGGPPRAWRARCKAA